MSSDSDSSNTPPRKVCKTHYNQKFSLSWLKEKSFAGWLEKSNKDDQHFYCKACRCDLKCGGGKSFISKHSRSDKHLANVKGLAHEPSITTLIPTACNSMDYQVKSGEIKMALFLAKNNLSFNIAGDLKDLVADVCPDSTIAKKLTFERTKSHAIITNVTGAAAENELIQLLKDHKFSLIVDESTDISKIKHLALIARTAKNYKVLDSFLCLIPISDGSAATLHKACCEYFSKHNIQYKENMIGFASDGANVMFGSDNSLSQLFKEDIPNLFLMKCICHSFHLCASYACKTLPNYVEGFARDIYNYFKHSPKRIADYAEFQAYVEIKPHKLLHPCQTRWLSLLPVVRRLLEQLPALKLFFSGAVLDDKLLAAQSILEQCVNPLVELYLNFLMFVLPYFHDLNAEMQSENPKIYVVYKRVFEIYTTLMECFIKPQFLELNENSDNYADHLEEKVLALDFDKTETHVALNEVYCGGNVAVLLESANFKSKIDAETVKEFKSNCVKFYIEGLKQIRKRFPFQDIERQRLKSLDFLHAQNFVGSQKRSIPSIAKIAALFPGFCSPNITELDREWRLLRHCNFPFSEIKTVDAEEFWRHVADMKNGDDSQRFPLLCDFVCRLLVLPHSSANVERIFSQINLMKTSQRNRLITETLNGLLHTKRFIQSGQNISQDQMKLFKKNMYNFKS